MFMLATAKSDTVFAGGEERVLSNETLSGIKRILGASRVPFIDSILTRHNHYRAFGQIMVADSFVGPGSDRVLAAFAISGSREIVVVPWSYGGDCQPYYWGRTARFATPNLQGVYVLLLRPDSLWVERRPTFDALDAQLYSYALGPNLTGPGKMFPSDTSTRPGTEPRRLLELYMRVPASKADTLRVRLLSQWLQANPDVQNTYPASKVLWGWVTANSPSQGLGT
jgi:hypothetical protein